MFDLDDDPNAAYDIVPCDRPPRWWTVTGNGIPVYHFAKREDAARYATDPEHRKAMVRKYLHERR
jgi:hypothetical protein